MSSRGNTPKDAIDPDTKVPEAVKRAAAKAAAAHSQAYQPPTGEAEQRTSTEATGGGGEGDNRAIGEPVPLSPSRTPARVQAQDVATGGDGNQQGNQPQELQPQPRADDWEHKYNSQQGRLASLDRANRALVERVNDLQNIITTMSLAPAPVAPRDPGQHMPATRANGAAQPAPSEPIKLLTEAEISEYGPEFVEVVKKAAREIYEPTVNQLQAEVERLNGQLQAQGQVTQDQARARLVGALNQEVPDWDAINRDPNFISWLSLPDAFSGVIRHALLKQAFERNDIPRVLAFFKGFLTEGAAVAPQGQVTDTGAAPHRAAERVNLEQLAAPGRARSAAGITAPAEKPVITTRFIQDFYVDVRRGKYAGNDAEKSRIEKEIIAASSEGRVVAG